MPASYLKSRHGRSSTNGHSSLEAQLLNIDKDLRKVMTSISAQNAQRTAQSVPQGNYFTFVKEKQDECKTSRLYICLYFK